MDEKQEAEFRATVTDERCIQSLRRWPEFVPAPTDDAYSHELLAVMMQRGADAIEKNAALVSREARLVALLERAQPIVFTFKLDRSVGGDRRAAVNAWLTDAAKELES